MRRLVPAPVKTLVPALVPPPVPIACRLQRSPAVPPRTAVSALASYDMTVTNRDGLGHLEGTPLHQLLQMHQLTICLRLMRLRQRFLV